MKLLAIECAMKNERISIAWACLVMVTLPEIIKIEETIHLVLGGGSWAAAITVSCAAALGAWFLKETNDEALIDSLLSAVAACCCLIFVVLTFIVLLAFFHHWAF